MCVCVAPPLLPTSSTTSGPQRALVLPPGRGLPPLLQALPIFIDRLADPLTAILVSVTVVLVFGEIIPQSICSRYGLKVGAYSAWFVKILMVLCSPISWPIAKLLDFLLGADHSVSTRRKEGTCARPGSAHFVCVGAGGLGPGQGGEGRGGARAEGYVCGVGWTGGRGVPETRGRGPTGKCGAWGVGVGGGRGGGGGGVGEGGPGRGVVAMRRDGAQEGNQGSNLPAGCAGGMAVRV